MTKMYLLIDWNSLKRSTRHATENSTSLHDEKSRPPGENHRAHQEVFQQGFDKKNEDRWCLKVKTPVYVTIKGANGIGSGLLPGKDPSSFESSWNSSMDELKEESKIKLLPGPRIRLETVFDGNWSKHKMMSS
ncbi:unnamed protein product [Bursaphelenchus xylophilus]|uniref:(pine wood nematode) hypothetical protein n=1 Tax=Bursaphelenchus xylophilus TaxID=6326 RepID=A0A7I8XN03_BURXY|nr:unnamed protein product [Bursaphelenchus xylophilus]CAG9089617.1 unnamed protein product [Bursaphelenchus xylophilus]